MSASCSSRVRFEVRNTIGRRARRDRPQLGDRDREVGQELEQERLELVVGPVDLVDQQHDRLRPGPASSASSSGRRSRNRRENSSPSSTPASAARSASSCRGVVPVVDRVMQVDSLVALQADQARAGGGRQRPRDLRLADAGLALEQQRLLERDREVDGQRERAAGEIALGGERRARLLH